MAVHERWSTTDLVWSLWISSLAVGYSLILTSILGLLVHGGPGNAKGGRPQQTVGPAVTTPLAQKQAAMAQTVTGNQIVPMNVMVFIGCLAFMGWSLTSVCLCALLLASTALAIGGALRGRPTWAFFPDPERGIARVVIMLPFGLFMLGFFTVHFLGFHFLHSMFLNEFFPLVRSSEWTFAFISGIAHTAIARYWAFVAASALSCLPTYVKAFETTDGSMMFAPYLNVIRMHVMIFVFAFMHMAKLQDVILYAVLIVYFLPFDSTFGWLWKRLAVRVPGGS